MFKPFTCELCEPDTERRYREAHIAAHQNQAVVTGCVLLVPLTGFFLSDLGFFTAATCCTTRSMSRCA